MYRVELSRSALKDLPRIPLPWRERVVDSIEALQWSPFLGKRLKGRFAGQRSMKVWPYRVRYIADEDKKLITILRARHRRDSYK